MTVQYTQTDLIQKIAQNNYSYKYSRTKKVTESDAAVEKLQSKADSFKKKVKALKRYTPGGISRDMLSGQVEDLVKSYNEMKTSSDTVTDKDVQKQIAKLEKLFSDNEKSLKKAGIEKANGKYTFNSKTFAEAADKTINSLFSGHDSFIDKAEKIMRKVEETADDAQYTVSEYKISQTQKYEAADMAMAAYMTLAGNTTSTLRACNGLVQSGGTSNNEVQNSVKTFLAYFAQSVYHADSANGSENTDKLNQLCLEHKDELAKLGMNFDSGQKNLVFDGNTDLTTNEFKTAYNALFGPNAAFGNSVVEYCKNIYNDIVQPEKLGVSILDEQA